jgi:hypothetical protein
MRGRAVSPFVIPKQPLIDGFEWSVERSGPPEWGLLVKVSSTTIERGYSTRARGCPDLRAVALRLVDHYRAVHESPG